MFTHTPLYKIQHTTTADTQPTICSRKHRCTKYSTIQQLTHNQPYVHAHTAVQNTPHYIIANATTVNKLDYSGITGTANKLDYSGITGTANKLDYSGNTGTANKLVYYGITGTVNKLDFSGITGTVIKLDYSGITGTANKLDYSGVTGTANKLMGSYLNYVYHRVVIKAL
jgi:hypothetical protein